MLFALWVTGCCLPKPTLHFEADAVVAIGNGTLTVRPKGGEPLLGKTQTVSGQIQFTPRFPFLAGQVYEAVHTDSNGQRTSIEHTFAIRAAAPRVSAVYPGGGILPANHLKFYLHFTEPMQRGNIFQHFQLINLTTGKPVDEPFRETELWSADGKRLTLWLHPGRQKTGVNLNLEFGPALNPHQRYVLEISGKWQSEAGVPLKNSFRKSFATTKADRAQPDLEFWEITPPKANTRDPLMITLPHPLDWALLHTMLTVLDAQDQRVDGNIEVSHHETVWRFRPTKPWADNGFRLKVGWELEDLAGNNLERLFEVNLETPSEPAFARPRYLNFTPK
ncbi:MAG: hypothetical protein H8E27_04120 [Verrucomicrobia subdivision 3 bacterium]|nr:hypothetical protein [Limisphaerales bacterium]